MAEADALRDWALTSPRTAPEPATIDQLARHLEFMAAALPSRANDVETGRMRASVYASMLSGHSNAALAFMCRRACETLEWFPSPKQCLDILAGYQPPESEQAEALRTCDWARHRFFVEWQRRLREGAEIGDVPDQWKRIAVEHGELRRLANGGYVSRALYHGPPRPPYRQVSAGDARADPPPIPAIPGASNGLTL